MKYRGLTLDPFQQQAIESIDEGRSVLVSAPTGTGKTLIADYLIEETLSEDRQIIYTAPIKALSNQKYREYTRAFGEEKVGLVTGDLVINPWAPLRIMTTEILRNILLQESTDLTHDEEALVPADTSIRDLEKLDAVIIDEIHFLDDPERGTVWEELLIYLPHDIRILGLSATLSNLDAFSDWLSETRNTDVAVVKEFTRAVPLEFHLASVETGRVSPKEYNKKFKTYAKGQQNQKTKQKGKGKRRDKRGRGKKGRARLEKTFHIDVLETLEAEHYPVLYFIYSRKLTEQLSSQLADSDQGRLIARLSDTEAIMEVMRAFDEKYPDVLSDSLRSQLKMGIAFHHAGLHVALKSLVEELYEKRLIRVLYCTSTFALGINMPARTVVFDSIKKFNGTDIVPLSVREFMQMAGRAGRRGIDDYGDVVIKLDMFEYEENRDTLRKLLSQESEPVSSSFNLSFNSVVNLLERYNEDQIRTILERSFKSHQYAVEAREVQETLDLVASGERSESRKELARLKRRLADASRPRLWEQFQRKVVFLQTYRYLDDHLGLNTAAKILQKIQFEEIFVTELILNGVLEDLTPEEIFGVMTGLSQTLPRTAKVSKPVDDKWWEIFDRIKYVYESDIVYRAQILVGSESVFTPALMPLGEMWANGSTLVEISEEIENPTDLSGDIVGSFRRAKDLVGQVRRVSLEDEDRARDLRALIRRVTRDEVEVID